MEINVLIEAPILVIKPTAASKEYVEIDLGSLTVKNKFEHQEHKDIKDGVWYQTYFVCMKDMTVKVKFTFFLRKFKFIKY
jgi:hypothetical protein